MGVAATIKAPNGIPIGKTDDIQRGLVRAFPGIQFTYHTYYRKQTLFEALSTFLPGGVDRALCRPGANGCYGDYKAGGLTAQFSFPLDDARQIDVELWGEAAAIREKFNVLTEHTNWRLTYDWDVRWWCGELRKRFVQRLKDSIGG